jgi:tetratricopeptide (TPR) repeat protein
VAVERAPDDAKAHYVRGLVLFLTSHYYPATNEANAALRINPDYVEALGLRATIYLNLQRWQEAVDDFRRAYELDPTYIDALYGLAQAYYGLGMRDEAITALEEYLSLASPGERNYAGAQVLLQLLSGETESGGKAATATPTPTGE